MNQGAPAGCSELEECFKLWKNKSDDYEEECSEKESRRKERRVEKKNIKKIRKTKTSLD